MSWVLLISLSSNPAFVFDQRFETKTECLEFRKALIRYADLNFDYSICIPQEGQQK